MQRNILTALSGLFLPLAGYAMPAAGSNTYQRSYLAVARQAPATDLAAHNHMVKNTAKPITNTTADELQLVQANPVKELVIIDAAVPDKAMFYRGVKPGVDIVEIESSAAGLPQLKAILANYNNLAAVHIVSHAQAGSLQLGNSTITAETLKAEVETFAALNGAVREGGDLLLYGCDLAANKKGEELLDIIQHNTHLDVAASNDLTGNLEQGADWNLEIQRGNIDTELAFSEKALKDFSAVLATYNLLNFTYNGNTPDADVQPGNPSHCPDNSPSQSYNYGSLSSGNYIACGFMHNNGYSGTTVALANYFGGDTNAFLKTAGGLAVAQETVSGTNHIEVRRSSGTFQLTNVVAGEFPGSHTFSSVKVIGYVSGGGTIESTAITSDTAAANTFTFTSGSQLSNFVGVNLTKFRLAFVNAGGSNLTYMTLNSFDAIQDSTPPTISSVNSSTANGTYKVGDVISVQVNFSESVTVASGTPQLTLETGTTDRTINYASGSGTSTLTFNYTVQAGDTAADLDYVTINSLTLNGATIRDGASNNATLTLASPGAANSLGDNKSIVIDGVAPAVTSVTSSTANGTYKTGDTVSVQVNFSEAVTITGTPQLTLETGSTDRTIDYIGGTGTNTLTFSYTILAGDNSADLDYVATNSLALNGGTISDAAGNSATLTLASPGAANSLGASKALVVDGVAPTVASVTSSTADGTYKAGDVISIQVSFTEAVMVTGTPQLTLETGSTDRTINFASGSGSATLSFSYTVQAGDSTGDLDYIATNALALNGGSISDAATNNSTLTLASPGAAGSLGANKALVIDSVAPTVSSIAPNGAPAANAASMVFTVTFDESVSNISGDDFTLVTTDTASGAIASVSAASGSAVDVTINTISGTGTLKLNLNGASNIVDDAGNGIAAYSAGSVHNVDRDAPAAPGTPDLDAASDTGVSNTDNVTSDNTPTFTGTTEADATVTVISSLSGTLGTTTADGAGDWSFTAGVMVNGSHNITATATDAAANVSSASAALAITIDGPVTVTTNADAGADATIDGSLAVDLADGAGLSLREAFAYVAASGTVDFAVGLNGTTITLSAPLTVPAGITIDADALGTATITGSTFTLAGSLSLTNGSADRLTLGTELSGAGTLTKTSAGRVILTNTNNTGYSGDVTVTAGELWIGSDSAFSTGTLTLDGGTLGNNMASFNLDNPIVLGASGGGIQVLSAAETLTLSGNI
ncbi:MAG TPA: DUF4347 domain-containing protein, partial [Rheinheimera sp.]|nr:DUF4347 domain-containing protein [Rheinheimera sp.]